MINIGVNNLRKNRNYQEVGTITRLIIKNLRNRLKETRQDAKDRKRSMTHQAKRNLILLKTFILVVKMFLVMNTLMNLRVSPRKVKLLSIVKNLQTLGTTGRKAERSKLSMKKKRKKDMRVEKEET